MTETSTVDPQAPIENLEITVRAFNALKGRGVHTLADLIKYSEAELLEIRNVGLGSIEDIKSRLEGLGFALKAGPAIPAPHLYGDYAFKTHENKMRRYAARQGFMLIKSPRRDPRARGFGRYILVPDDRSDPHDNLDDELLADAHLKLDRGDGVTIEEIEKQLGYGIEED